MAVDLKDGEYEIELSLSGGSGKASLKSPARVNVRDGEGTVRLEWSSKNYDYMEWEGGSYAPVNTDGNSVFEVRLPELDTDITFKAETTAMSTPHLIEYTVRFDSATLRAINSTNVFLPVCAGVLCAAVAIVIGMRVKNVKK